MRKTEHPHHTHEQVESYLSDALAIVGRLELDGDLRGIAYAKAVDLLAAKQIFFEQATLGVPLGGGRG